LLLLPAGTNTFDTPRAVHSRAFRMSRANQQFVL